MPNYRGPATLTVAGQEPRDGNAVLHSSMIDGQPDWRGSFAPDDGQPVAIGTATLTTKTWTGDVVIEDYRRDGTFGRAILVGQDAPPF